MKIAGSDRLGAVPGMSALAREGLVGGLLSAAALALWFFVTDTLAGQPFHTPALLGARLFGGPTPSSGSIAGPVAGYTLFHGLAFVAAGLMVAWAVAAFERTPPLMIPGSFFLVVFFEFVYYTYVLAFVEPVLGQVNWPAVLVGNLLAAASMVGYFWRRHPDLLRRLARD
ncbi:MAG: hypothetical protein JSW46_08195 [Gemmatimonadota bacterium]|nr:MAG: hypothetical protein JSW46_08195 [Gemmatimonadota bacterium]